MSCPRNQLKKGKFALRADPAVYLALVLTLRWFRIRKQTLKPKNKDCIEAEIVGAADMHQFWVDIIFVDCLVLIGN